VDWFTEEKFSYQKLSALRRSEALWKDWQINILKAEWPNPKLSASDIGILIQKSRNAVIGKGNRLKLGKRAPSSKNGKRKTKTERSLPPKQDMAIVSKKVSPPRFYAEARPLTTKPPIAIGELRLNTCRAPVGRGPDGLVTYCGDFTFYDKPYCEGHCALFYRPPEYRYRRY